MSTELANKLYENIGRIKHLRTFEFLKAIEENKEEDGYSRITYAQWRDKYAIHAFILNECTRECEVLGFIQVARENKNGIAKEGGGKGTKRIYRLTLDNVGDNEKPIPEKAKTPKPTVRKASKKPASKKPASAKKKTVPSKKLAVKKAVKKVVKKKAKK